MSQTKIVMIKDFQGKLLVSLSAALLFFSISGCQTTRAPKTPYQSWTPSAKEDISLQDDPVRDSIAAQEVETQRPLALVELINIALANNPQTRQAWEDARQYEAIEGQAQSRWYPQVTLSGDASKHKVTASQEVNDVNRLVYGPEIQLTYLLLDFGGRTAAVEEAMNMLLAANYQFNQSFQDLLLNVSEAYYSLYSSYSRQEAAEADVEDSQKVLEKAQQKYEVGLGSKLDLLQEQSNYDDAMYNLEQAKGEVKTAAGNLAEALGLSADTPISIASPAKEVPTDISEENVSALIAEALKRKPRIAAMRATLKAKEAAVTVANSELWPILSVSGSADKNWYHSYAGDYYYESGDAQGDDYGYKGYLAVQWNIFDGFYNLNKKREAQAQRDAQRELLAQEELAAGTEVWNQYYNFRTAKEKLAYSKAFLENAQGAYELALEGYNNGLKSMVDLLQAQSQLSSARSKLIQTQKDLFFALAELAHATGSIYLEGSLAEEISESGV